jgi:biopolymer transport protein ExbD
MTVLALVLALTPAALDPDAAACARAAVTAPFVPLADRFGHVSRACAGLFRDTACRHAWTTAAEQPAYSRAAYLIDACRAAYCPSLKPRPTLCAGELTPTRMLSEGAELVRAALAHDHGPDFAASMAALVPPPSGAAPIPAAPPSVPADCEAVDPPVLRVAMNARHRLAVAWETCRGKPRRLTLPRKRFPTALGRVVPRVAAGAALVVDVSPEVKYASVVELLDALRSLGYENVSLAAQGGPEPK